MSTSDEPRDRLINVDRLLRDAQAEIAPLLAKGEALAVQAALGHALFLVRAALDKTSHKSAEWRAVEGRSADHDDDPREGEGGGAQAGDSSASPPNTAPARRAPERIEATRERIRRLKIQDADGREIVVERDDEPDTSVEGW